MKKRILAVLLCAMLLITLLPTAAFAAENYTMNFMATTAQAWAGGKAPATEDALGAGWSWEYQSKTLTLSGLDFTTTAATAMELPDDSRAIRRAA